MAQIDTLCLWFERYNSLQIEKNKRGKFLNKRYLDVDYKKVARDGIEPPTQGFSVLCSTV